MDPRDSRYVDLRYRRARRSAAPRGSTGALTMRLVVLAVAASLLIGGLIATEMAAGNDPALGPKAVAQAKRSVAKKSTGTSSNSSGSGTDPYAQSYGDDGYAYGSSGGYSSGSGGYSSGSSGYSYSPPPVTSGTS
jgi:hypothetical protein